MQANSELNRALVNAARFLTDLRSLYGGDLTLKDVKGPGIVTELKRVREVYPEFSRRANVIIALIAEASISSKAVLDPRA